MFTAASVMDISAALLNDSAKLDYTYDAQLPYLNIAASELKQIFQEYNVPLTNKTDATITVDAGVLTIGGGGTDPALPVDLIEIQGLYERLDGSTDNWVQMTRREYLPELVTQTESLVFWAWMGEVIRFIGATTDRQIKINYIADSIPKIWMPTDQIRVINAENFLFYRTAALCAEFIGENGSRATTLNGNAGAALDMLLITSTKGRQSIFTRRRPFMAAYKQRGMI